MGTFLPTCSRKTAAADELDWRLCCMSLVKHKSEKWGKEAKDHDSSTENMVLWQIQQIQIECKLVFKFISVDVCMQYLLKQKSCEGFFYIRYKMIRCVFSNWRYMSKNFKISFAIEVLKTFLMIQTLFDFNLISLWVSCSVNPWALGYLWHLALRWAPDLWTSCS